MKKAITDSDPIDHAAEDCYLLNTQQVKHYKSINSCSYKHPSSYK